ncbi:GH39 family glycosyl hydrolase [Paucibacter sp. M5-1]|uniref:GH39 family glycosyl hydrolase n=1 Tax=Paucibacter sp. M5-1 TaxID=3015998 RepID=UPI0022B8EC03|nr:beta-galactosidase [Paucibacter sp. M5-1]MCZ7883023.1 beta-galactosidase [Paucibacter sp. M5-1]
MLLLALAPTVVQAQILDSSPERVVTNLDIRLPKIGTVKARSTAEIAGSNWLLGCETLDRDFADYDQYKEFIAPLGIKRLRMQAGWAKTEKVKGQYDFAWLDHIVNDATRRGFQPWLQTSYGNSLYPGGGGANLGAGMPTSKEALEAYERWVTALVTRYKDKVDLWEVWNEPNFGDNTVNTPEMSAEFNIRTAEIIKKIQPQAKISGLALGHYNKRFVEGFFKHIGAKAKFGLFDNMTYHDYVYNPDFNHHEVMAMKAELEKYTKTVKLRQGENGAPSAGGIGRGALWDHDWTELSQAKWNTRRMLGNLGNGIESSVFGLVEMAYTFGPINRMNFKGLLKSDASKRVIRPKIAYYAIQNVTSVFDDSLVRLKDVEHTHNLASAGPEDHLYTLTTDRKVAVYGYEHRMSKKQVYTLWLSESIPSNSNDVRLQDFSVSNGNFEQPVVVDILTGAVYEIPAAQWNKKGNTYSFKNIPLYDAPVLVADKSLINISQ